MEFIFQDKTYGFPTSLSAITLQQRIDFHEQYGKDISEIETGYSEIEGGIDEIDLLEHQLSVACKSFSFFSGIPLEDVFKIPVSQVSNVYHACLKQLLEQQEDIALETKFLWGDDIWTLAHPDLTYQSELTFNEFITSKQIVKQMDSLGKGRWDALPFLCAIFLKKEGEQFDEAWVADGSERLELMKQLPLDIALSVGFFLNCSMSMYLHTSASLEAEAVKDQT